jgi:hypothetical protein
MALGRVGTKEAAEVIEEAHASGPRGVRNAVRPHLAKLRAKRDAEVKA